jgi:hypothetical protein
MANITLLKPVNRLNSTVVTLVFLSGLMMVRLIIQALLYRQGFISVSADEFARGLRALDWSQNPRFTPAADLIDAWPPFEMYINGPMLLLMDDVLLAPRITVFIASCLLLAALFFLVRYLFNGLTAALAISLVAAQPWTIWLSGTPMLEMYFLACFVGGLYFIMVWLHQQRRYYWLYAGLLFFLASGFHVQSWVLINLVNLFTCLFCYQFVRQGKIKLVVRLLAFWVLGNSYIIFWGVAEYIMTGQVFAILSSHTFYSLWFYDGYNVPTIEKLLYFPRIVWSTIAPLLWLFAGIGLLSGWRDSERLTLRMLPLLLAGVTLLWASIFNMASGPPSAAPDRYMFLYLLLLSPYMAYGIYRLCLWGWHIEPRSLAYLVTALISLLFGSLLIQSVAASTTFPPGGMPQDTVETGRYLHRVLAEPDLGQPSLAPAETVMLEARYWDFLALELITRQNEQLIYDRDHDYLNRDNPSLLWESDSVVYDQLIQKNVGLVVLRDPPLQERANSLSFFMVQDEIGDWILYRFIDGSP